MTEPTPPPNGEVPVTWKSHWDWQPNTTNSHDVLTVTFVTFSQRYSDYINTSSPFRMSGYADPEIVMASATGVHAAVWTFPNILASFGEPVASCHHRHQPRLSLYRRGEYDRGFPIRYIHRYLSELCQGDVYMKRTHLNPSILRQAEVEFQPSAVHQYVKLFRRPQVTSQPRPAVRSFEEV
jgi:hypothetical protein